MWQQLKAWYADPFDADNSATDWFLFIGLVIVSAILWKLILRHIIDGVS